PHLPSGANAENSRVDYDVLVPAEASVTLESGTGPRRAERLHGDVEAEGANAAVDVKDMSGGHVHVKTMAGPITLTNIRDGHVEIDSVSGDVTLTSVTGPLVRVSSTSGRIQYNGDFGYAGEYRFNSHSGNIEAPAARRDAPVRAIFLVGFMGAGKTSVGRALSRKLGWRFEDLDDRIHAREGRTIPEIFQQSGEAEFRRSELAALRDLLADM